MARVAQHGESQFILRFPRKLAERVERMMSDQGPHEIAIDMMTDQECVVKVGKNQFPGTLVDLPTHVETYKTMNRRTYFKSNDVGQVLVVHSTAAAAEAFRKRQRKKSATTADSGITPPTHMIARYYREQPYNKTEQRPFVERAAALLRNSKPQYEEFEVMEYYPSFMDEWGEAPKTLQMDEDTVESERKKGHLPIPGLEAYKRRVQPPPPPAPAAASAPAPALPASSAPQLASATGMEEEQDGDAAFASVDNFAQAF